MNVQCPFCSQVLTAPTSPVRCPNCSQVIEAPPRTVEPPPVAIIRAETKKVPRRRSSLTRVLAIGVPVALGVSIVGAIGFFVANQPDERSSKSGPKTSGVFSSVAGAVRSDHDVVEHHLKGEYGDKDLRITRWLPDERLNRASIRRGDGVVVEVIVESRAEAQQMMDATPQQPCVLESLDTITFVRVQFEYDHPLVGLRYCEEGFLVIDGKAMLREQRISGTKP